jgi:hypothetical protein
MFKGDTFKQGCTLEDTLKGENMFEGGEEMFETQERRDMQLRGSRSMHRKVGTFKGEQKHARESRDIQGGAERGICSYQVIVKGLNGYRVLQDLRDKVKIGICQAHINTHQVLPIRSYILY